MTQSAITARTAAFLASLERRPAVSVARARARLAGVGLDLRPSWETFQRDFAGYVIPLGFEQAVLGLVHDGSAWLGDSGIDWDSGPEGTSICCADAHPSFDFWLGPEGAFAGSGAGGPTDSFHRYVEQCALLHAVGPGFSLDLDTPQSELAALADEGVLDEAASDRHSSWLVADDWVIRRSEGRVPANQRRYMVWRRRA